MKKITIMALHLGYGGIENYICSLTDMLNKNYDLELIVTYSLKEKPSFNIPSNVKVKYLLDEKPNKKELISAFKHFNIIKIFKNIIIAIKILYKRRKLNIDAIKNIDSDYIITTRIFHNNLVGRYANKNIKLIATDHNHHNNNYVYIRNLIRSVEKFDYFVAISKDLFDSYKDLMKPKAVYIPNVLDEIPAKKSSKYNHNLINVSRFSKEKGLFDLIDIIEIIKKDIDDIKLYLIGDGILSEDIKKYVIDRNLVDNVILPGFVKKDDMSKYYLDSSLFISTSFTESFGLVLLESLSYKVPCLSFETSGALEILNKDNGIIIKNRNKKLMAKKIIELLNNKNQLKYFKDNSLNILNKFSKNNIKEEWYKLIGE